VAVRFPPAPVLSATPDPTLSCKTRQSAMQRIAPSTSIRFSARGISSTLPESQMPHVGETRHPDPRQDRLDQRSDAVREKATMTTTCRHRAYSTSRPVSNWDGSFHTGGSFARPACHRRGDTERYFGIGGWKYCLNLVNQPHPQDSSHHRLQTVIAFYVSIIWFK
jgi:hypothetical protein